MLLRFWGDFPRAIRATFSHGTSGAPVQLRPKTWPVRRTSWERTRAHSSGHSEHGRVDPGLNSIGALELTNLGQLPTATSAEQTAFWNQVYADHTKAISWWLDCMYASDYPLTERMTWFWHGHWATSLEKVVFANAMMKQISTLRTHSTGNFRDIARSMVVDGAFQYWLDNEENYLSSPNENLARELMELMVLGVNKFTQDDVRAASYALTGYSVNVLTGAVNFKPSQHYSKPVTILGTHASLNAETLAELIVSRPENAKFIPARLWFRWSRALPPRRQRSRRVSRTVTLPRS